MGMHLKRILYRIYQDNRIVFDLGWIMFFDLVKFIDTTTSWVWYTYLHHFCSIFLWNSQQFSTFLFSSCWVESYQLQSSSPFVSVLFVIWCFWNCLQFYPLFYDFHQRTSCTWIVLSTFPLVGELKLNRIQVFSSLLAVLCWDFFKLCFFNEVSFTYTWKFSYSFFSLSLFLSLSPPCWLVRRNMNSKH